VIIVRRWIIWRLAFAPLKNVADDDEVVFKLKEEMEKKMKF
jgi:hypothetical protein